MRDAESHFIMVEAHLVGTAMVTVEEFIESFGGVIVALVTVALALLGYMYNARKQRALERNKMQYAAKLRAFKNLIREARAVMIVSHAFKGLADRIEDKRDVGEAGLIAATVGQDLEAPLGTDTAKTIHGLVVEVLSEVDADGDSGAQAPAVFTRLCSSALLNLSFLYKRIFAYHHNRLGEAIENAGIVMEDSDEFDQAVSAFIGYLWPTLNTQSDRIETIIENLSQAVPSYKSPEKKEMVYEEDKELMRLWSRVLDAMNGDLFATL